MTNLPNVYVEFHTRCEFRITGLTNWIVVERGEVVGFPAGDHVHVRCVQDDGPGES